MAAEVGLDLDVLALEIELVDTSKKGLSDFLELLGNDRQHFDKNTVELIEAGPAALHSKTSEVTLHHLIIDLIGAVVHDTEACDTLGKILCGLSLTSSGRASRVGTELNVQGASNSDPTFVSEGCDDQPRGSAEILEAVEKLGLYLTDDTHGLR